MALHLQTGRCRGLGRLVTLRSSPTYRSREVKARSHKGCKDPLQYWMGILVIVDIPHEDHVLLPCQIAQCNFVVLLYRAWESGLRELRGRACIGL